MYGFGRPFMFFATPFLYPSTHISTSPSAMGFTRPNDGGRGGQVSA